MNQLIKRIFSSRHFLLLAPSMYFYIFSLHKLLNQGNIKSYENNQLPGFKKNLYSFEERLNLGCGRRSQVILLPHQRSKCLAWPYFRILQPPTRESTFQSR